MVNAFNTTSEEMKTAASYALGRLALGNLEKYLPFLLEQINSQPKRQYLLLHALKEVQLFLYLFTVICLYVPYIQNSKL